jgi:hypothetical protein
LGCAISIPFAAKFGIRSEPVLRNASWGKKIEIYDHKGEKVATETLGGALATI